MGSLHNNIHLIGPTLFLLYINDFSDVIGIYQVSNQWQQLDVIYRTLWTGAESALLISILEKFNWFCLTSAIDVRMYGLVIVEKSAFRIMGLTFSSILDWGSYFIPIAKIAFKKIGTLIFYLKFLSPEVALYLYKSTIQPWMEYCCNVWAVAPSCLGID